jgi:hypothetical protein
MARSLILDNTTGTIEIVLAGAITTNQLEITAHYADITSSGSTPGNQFSSSNSTTDVDIVDAPAASTQRVIADITVYNADTVVATVTIKHDDASTEHVLYKFDIDPGETWELSGASTFPASALATRAEYDASGDSDYTTTSTSFVSVGANFALTIVTSGGDVEMGFTCNGNNSGAGGLTYFDVYESVAAARLGNTDGLSYLRPEGAGNSHNLSFTFRATGLAAGSHTFTLYWKVSAGTGKFFANSTATVQMTPFFWVREVKP